MLLFLALYHFASTQAFPLIKGTAITLSTRSAVSCDNIDDCRKLNDIIWSCVTTIFACTWLTLHPNIPPPVNKKDMNVREKCSSAIKIFLKHQILPFTVTFMAPEWVLAWAMQQRIVASQIAKEGNANIRSNYSEQYSHTTMGRLWTRAHGFFVIMGGFHAYTRDDSRIEKHLTGKPWYPLDQKTVMEKVQKEETELPLEEEIQDKSKTDWLAKTLVLLQNSWFMIQCIARGIAHLPLSELEVVTLAYTIMNVAIYTAWWDKPRNVNRPIRVFMPKEVVEKEKEAALRYKPKIDSLRDLWFYWSTSLVPGINAGETRLCMYSSVPTFNSGEPDHSEDFWQSAYVASVVGAVFGAIHFIAWSYSFPSHTERLLWRSSSVIMVGIPSCVFVGSWLAPLGDRLDNPNDQSLLWKICFMSVALILGPLTSIISVLGPLIYVFARVVTFVLAFKTLPSLPAAAFQTIPWTKWIPHI
jgi:hypothetical protein